MTENTFDCEESTQPITPDLMRAKLDQLEKDGRRMIEDLKSQGIGEAIAQATLAMRHIEDARMRYGKVIQYLGDGVSIYDKK